MPYNKASLTGVMAKIEQNLRGQCLKVMTVGRKSASGQGNKLRTYVNIKDGVCMEHYLLDRGLSWREKNVIAKFRTGDHKLRIETGRHCRPRLPPEQRLCTRCQLNKVEDEVHILIECPLYALLRDKHFIKVRGIQTKRLPQKILLL